MAQLQRVNTYGGTPNTPTVLSHSTTSAPTVEQLRRVDRASSQSSATNTSPTFWKEHDMEEDHAHQPKKSVLAKVKERAKKWRNTLAKKKHGEDANNTPLWGVSLEEDEEEDAEYLGAPIYESELAPEECKENARQHPRAIPVIPETHVLNSSVQQGVENPPNPSSVQRGFENPPNPSSVRRGIENPPNPSSVHRGFENPPNPSSVQHAAAEQDDAKPLNKTITESVTEKLAPAYAAVSETAQAISSKIQGLSRSVVSAPAPDEHASATGGREQASAAEQIWDKGVSVKEYLMQKLEPGEDDRALSQVISDAVSPKKTPDDVGVMDKVKEAVTSMLQNEESSTSKIINPATNSSSRIPVSTNAATNSSSHIPASTNAHEVVEDENHGRILQAN